MVSRLGDLPSRRGRSALAKARACLVPGLCPRPLRRPGLPDLGHHPSRSARPARGRLHHHLPGCGLRHQPAPEGTRRCRTRPIRAPAAARDRGPEHARRQAVRPADCLPLLVIPVSRSMTVTGKTLHGRASRPPVNYHRPSGPGGSLSSQHKTSTMRFREAVQHTGNTDGTALRGTHRHGCKNAAVSL
jgi:hypothetical protein